MEATQKSGFSLNGDSLHGIDSSKWSWKQIEQKKGAKYPSPRHLHSLVSYNNDLYLFGGYGAGEKYFGDFWKFETVKNRWTKLSKSGNHGPSPRHSHQAVVHKGKMCIFGGISNGETMGDLWSYDFDDKTWSVLNMTDNNGVGTIQINKPRWGHSMVVLGDEMIIFGGADSNVKPTNDVIVIGWGTYFPPNNLGTSFPQVDAKELPSPRQYASMVTYDNAIYLFGGFNGRESLNDLYRITLANDRVVCESLPVPSFIPKLRGASLSVLVDQRQLVLFGGRTNQQLSSGQYLFSLGSSKWTEQSLVGPSPRYYHQACVVNGTINIFGGLGLSGHSDKSHNLDDLWTLSGESAQYNLVEHRSFVPSANFNPDFIPLEIWNSILEYLCDSDHGKNVASASIVSKQFYKIVKSNDTLNKALEAFILSQNIVVGEIGEVIKIAVAGMGGSGKSASTIQFIQSHFVDEYDPTIEDSYRKQVKIDQATYLLDILDMAGPEEYSAMLQQAYRGAHGIYGVYNITNPLSLLELRTYLNICRGVKDGAKFPLIVCGNKCDLESERKVSQEEGKALAKEFGGLWMETSAKLRHNIDEAFIGLARHILESSRVQNKRRAPNNGNKKDRCMVM